MTPELQPHPAQYSARKGEAQHNDDITLVQLAQRIARVEALLELYAPFTWVHDLVVPIRSAIGEIRETLVGLGKDNEHIVSQLEQLTEKLEGAVEQIESVSRARSEDQAQSLRTQVETLTQQIQEVKDKAKKPDGFWPGLVTFADNWKKLAPFLGGALFLLYKYGLLIAQNIWDILEGIYGAK